MFDLLGTTAEHVHLLSSHWQSVLVLYFDKIMCLFDGMQTSVM